MMERVDDKVMRNFSSIAIADFTGCVTGNSLYPFFLGSASFFFSRVIRLIFVCESELTVSPIPLQLNRPEISSGKGGAGD